MLSVESAAREVDVGIRRWAPLAKDSHVEHGRNALRRAHEGEPQRTVSMNEAPASRGRRHLPTSVRKP